MEKRIEALFGTIVRRHREANGVSQEDFADLAGIHRTYQSSIERGKVQVSIGIAYKLAKALGISLSQLWSELETGLESEEKPKPVKTRRRSTPS